MLTFAHVRKTFADVDIFLVKIAMSNSVRIKSSCHKSSENYRETPV